MCPLVRELEWLCDERIGAEQAYSRETSVEVSAIIQMIEEGDPDWAEAVLLIQERKQERQRGEAELMDW